MKKFFVGVVVAIFLTCAWGLLATVQQHRAAAAEQAARAAAEAAAAHSPVR